MTTGGNTERSVGNSAEDKIRLDDAFERLKKKCKKEDFQTEELDVNGDGALRVRFGRRPTDPTIRVTHLDQAENLLGAGFERYIPLSNYEAILCREHGEIEAAIGTIGSGPWGGSGRDVLETLRKKLGKGASNNVSVIQLTSPDGKTRIAIAKTSKTLLAFFPRKDPDKDRASLYLRGLDLSNCSPIDMLERLSADALVRISDSLFFELDRARVLTLGLRRVWPFTARPRPPVASVPDLKVLRYEFKKEAMECYWYAKSAFNMPDLQFLLYYETIECFFSESRGLGALKRTLECIDVDALRKFLTNDERMYHFFAGGDHDHFFGKKINLECKSPVLLSQVADRIYSLRNEIAHSGERGRARGAGIFPRCRYEHHLDFDIGLIRYLARQVIFAKRGDLRSERTR